MWRAAPCNAAGRARAASPPAFGRRSQTLATNFSQVSGPGSAAPLSVSARRSVRPRVFRAREPVSPGFSGGRGLDGWGDPGTGGRGLKKTRHHLGSRVCAGAAPAFPTPGPFRAQAVAPPLPRWLEPSVPAQVSVATCECRRRQRALGVHVQPRLCVSVCVYPGCAEEEEPGTPGGRRDQQSLLPLPPPDLKLAGSPPPFRPLPTLLLLLFFTSSAGLGEWRVRRAPRSLRTVWRLATLGVTGGCPYSAQRYHGSAGSSRKPLLGESRGYTRGAELQELQRKRVKPEEVWWGRGGGASLKVRLFRRARKCSFSSEGQM